MKNDPEKKFKKTQSTSSPGALGEEVNRDRKKSSKSIAKENGTTAKEEGINQERSAGDAGAFEGLENASS